MITELGPFSIPYEQQTFAPDTRQCGAACLSMVYRSLNKVVSQSEIWAAISKEDRFGTFGARTHLMTRDALNRGWTAVAVQTSNPLQALRNCCDSGIRVIVNHSLELGKPPGHYSVLLNIDEECVYVHDPLVGPARRLSHVEFLQLWSRQGPDSEIAGHVLIAIDEPAQEPPVKTPCPRCKARVLVPPAELCASMSICPSCDHAFPCDAKAESLATKFDLSSAFAQLDKFSALVKSVPGIAQSPEVLKQLDALALQKQNILAAVQAFEKNAALRKQQMAAMEKAANDAKEAHERKLAGLKTPLPPLDGHALGLALLQRLGFRPAVAA